MQQRLVRLRSVLSVLPTLVWAAVGAPAVEAQRQSRPADWNPDQVLQRENYTRPPEAIAEAVLAPRYLNVTLSEIDPTRSWFLDEVEDGPVNMDRFAIPFHDLGGVFVDYGANRDRALTTRSNAGLQLFSAEDGSSRRVQLPAGTRVSGATWSPDGSRVAFYGHTTDATHIYVAGTDGRAERLTQRPVLATLYTTFDWSDDGRTLATVLVPGNRAAMPQKPAIPMGPQVKQTEEGENMLRVYASLLATPYDKDLLEWHVTGQVALIDVESGRATEVGEPAMIRSLDVSPDGAHVLVERMVKPFSYVVPVRQFGSVQEIWDRDGNVLALVSEEELDTGLEGGPRAGGAGFSGSGESEGPRDLAWRAEGLTYLEQAAAPEREEGEEAEGERPGQPDRLVLWTAPFSEGNKTVLFENDREMSWVRFGSDADVLFAAERRGGNVHEFVVFLDEGPDKLTLARYDADDLRENPGSLVGDQGRFPTRSRWGASNADADVLISSDGSSAFYAGIEYHEDPMEQAPVAFVDRIDLRTGATERIYASPNDGVSERPRAYIDLEDGDFIVTRESATQVEQSYRLDGGNAVQLTENVDYTPDLTTAPRRQFTVSRPDGFKFRVNVTLPPGYTEGTRLPAMFWFYPREYTDQDDYDETGITYDKNAFPSFGTRSMEYLVRLGYAVVEPDAPIVGDQGRMNDNYERDLRNNLAAVIDHLDEQNIIDRKRLGLGGHSYGAFSTLNAMVHTPFFKAGIAGDGNYNRTLTPLHFQSERRTLWEAREVYIAMSPFLQADDLTGSVLLYHGLHDQNVGTDPIHSPKLFHALNGLDKDAAMYLYPFEDHGPASEETLLDLWARWTAWLDKHLLETPAQQNVISDEQGSTF